MKEILGQLVAYLFLVIGLGNFLLKLARLCGSSYATCLMYATRNGVKWADCTFSFRCGCQSIHFPRLLRNTIFLAIFLSLWCFLMPDELRSHALVVGTGITFLIVAELGYTIFWMLTPPHVVFLGRSGRDVWEILRFLNWQFPHLRICHLLVEPEITVDSSYEERLPNFFSLRQVLNNLRTRTKGDRWRIIVDKLIQTCPLVIIDKRNPTDLVLYEIEQVQKKVPPINAMLWNEIPSKAADVVAARLEQLRMLGKSKVFLRTDST